MKFVVEDGFSKIQKTGIGQYTMMFENLLRNLDCDIIVVEKPFLSKIKNKILRRIFYNLWLNTIFLFKLLLLNSEIMVFCTNYSIPIFKLSKVKFISVIHDLCMFKYPKLSSKLINIYEKANVKNAIKNADKIITVSNTVKEEILEIFKLSNDNIYVVNSSLTTGLVDSPEIDFSVIENKYSIKNKKYILSVATNNKRKNISLLIEAFNKISDKYSDIKLVLVGNNYNEQNNDNIVITGYITDSELKSLYKNALLYVFPSLYEGFGTPLIDAQSYGVPVLCSDIPIFKEVGGNSVEFCEFDTNKLVQKIEYLISIPQRANELIENGFMNVHRFLNDKIRKQLKEVVGK